MRFKMGWWLALVTALLALASPAGVTGGTTAAASASSADGEGQSVWPTTLSLVYMDQRSGNGVDLWVAAYDGSDARIVASFPNGTRALAVSGPHVALAVSDGIALLDLRDGEARTVVQRGLITSGLIAGDTLFYVVRNACGGPDAGRGQLVRVDIPTRTRSDLGPLESSGASIAGYDPDAKTLTLVPYGCDPGFRELLVMDATTGALVDRHPVEGCGWGAASPDGTLALVSEQACAGDDPDGGPVTVYNFADGSRQPLRPPEGRFTQTRWLISPNGPFAAFALSVQRGMGPASTRSDGLWLMNLQLMNSFRLWNDGGAEALPVAFSPDGAHVLAGSVQAMGVCSYAVIALLSGEVRPVSDGITVCGANGEVLGWTSIG
jgi:hypothetical protein